MSEIALPLQLGGKNYQPKNHLLKNSFQKFHGQRFFLLLYKGQGGGTIESNRTKTKRQI